MAPLPTGWIQARLYHLLSPLAALALVFLLGRFTPLIQAVENMTVDMRFKARASFDPPADPRLVFVGIDETSLTHLGRYPWPRSVIADFAKTLAEAGATPHTVAFDLMWTEESNKLDQAALKPGEDNDVNLGDALGLLPSAITGAFSLKAPKGGATPYDIKATADKLTQPGPTQPITHILGDVQQLHGSDVADLPVLPIRTQSLFGFVNDDPSPIDGIRHTVPLAFRVQDKVYPSFALQTLCQMLNVDTEKVEIDLRGRQVRLTDSSGKLRTIPINGRGEFAINYRQRGNRNPKEGQPESALSFFLLMQNLGRHMTSGSPIAPECNVSNKTLIVGEADTGLVDMGPSPLAGRMPLPYVHLNVIDNVLKGDYLRFVPWWWVVIGWALVTWPTLVRLKDAPLGEAIAVPVSLAFVYITAAFAIFWVWSIQIALFWPLATYAALNFGGVVLRWREERRGREELKQIFSQMVSPEIVSHILDQPGNMKLGGSDRAATILFSDIRDYTGFSEGLEAAEVMRQLNAYFERMVPCVKECRGTFHKFIGDAIMAAWGDLAPLSAGPADDARNAVRSALMMRERLAQLNDERRTLGFVPLRIGIGLNHGVVQAGMLGTSDRKEFTVMGDGVNTASRLEGLTKEFKTDLAVSESVRQLIGDEFLVRRLGLIVLKGKSEATVVYEVLAETSDLAKSRLSPEAVAQYEDAFDHFLKRRFAKAVDGFTCCERESPDDYCVQNYLQASRKFGEAPPPDDWDGRIVMTTK